MTTQVNTMIRLFFSFYVMLFLIVFTHQIVGEFASENWILEMIEKDKANDNVGLFYLIEQLQRKRLINHTY